MTQKKTDKKTETIPVFNGILNGYTDIGNSRYPKFDVDIDNEELPKVGDTIIMKAPHLQITCVVKSVKPRTISVHKTQSKKG